MCAVHKRMLTVLSSEKAPARRKRPWQFADFVFFWGAEGAPILFSEIGFCMASCSYIYIYIYIYVCIYISVKMAAPWGSLTLLSYYSLCPHLRCH